MECKVNTMQDPILCFKIGIYPEWNVKLRFDLTSAVAILIGIYPEWNVKCSCSNVCFLNIRIGIYPEWNVKVAGAGG